MIILYFRVERQRKVTVKTGERCKEKGKRENEKEG
jgi:hypothetical protein